MVHQLHAFESETTSVLGGGMKALGVGDIHLDVRTEQGQSTLVLHDVLHCPSSICNILGLAGVGNGYEMQLAGPEDSWLRHTQIGTVYLLDHVVLWKLWLVGQQKGQSSLSPGGMYFIQSSWPQQERARFERQKARFEQDGNAAAGADGLSGSQGGQQGVKAA